MPGEREQGRQPKTYKIREQINPHPVAFTPELAQKLAQISLPDDVPLIALIDNKYYKKEPQPPGWFVAWHKTIADADKTLEESINKTDIVPSRQPTRGRRSKDNIRKRINTLINQIKERYAFKNQNQLTNTSDIPATPHSQETLRDRDAAREILNYVRRNLPPTPAPSGFQVRRVTVGEVRNDIQSSFELFMQIIGTREQGTLGIPRLTGQWFAQAIGAMPLE